MEEGDFVSGTMADLKRLLAAGPPEGLHVLLGDDELARDEASRLIEQTMMKAEGGCDRTVAYGDETEADEIAVAAGTGSLFGFRRLVVVRRFDAMPASAQERLVPVLTRLPAGVCVVLVAKALDKRMKATKALLSAGRAFDFSLPRPAQLPGWVTRRAAELGVRLQGDAARTLIDMVGTNPLALQTELEKLAVYAAGESVTPAVVQEAASVAIPHAAELAVFQMAEAVADGRTKEALSVLDDLLSVGEYPLVVLSLIGRQYRLILTACGLQATARPGALARALGIPQAAARRVAAQARALGPEGAASGLRRVLEADIAIKKGLEPRLVLETLVVALSSLKSKATGKY